ncbi:MAG: protein kinase [Gemmatimonadales bacterium]
MRAAEGFTLKKDIFLGRRVAVYRIDEFLGEGGFAFVYKARDTNLEIDVALKVLKPAFAYDEVFEANFRREAHRAAKFRHPNVIAIHYAGKDDDIVFFSMDLLETGLKDLLKAAQPLERDVIVKVGSDVASALQFAHTHEGGIVHRDLKPDNILFDRHGNAVVTDFGIAEAATNYTAATGTTVYVGTPKYMSPEQARGQRVDQRSDIYSLGVTLYEMATGQPPFTGRDWFELGRKHIEDLPPLPRERNPDLDKGIERIILKCLQKIPSDRYQNADELGSDLAAVTQRSVSAPAGAEQGADRPTPPARRTSAEGAELFGGGRRTSGRRRPLVWVVALAVLVGAVSSYGLDVGGLRRLGEERFPVLAQLPLVGSGNVYATDLSYASIEGGADVEAPTLEIAFSGAIDPATANSANVQVVGPDGRPVRAEISVANAGKLIVLKPTQRLAYDSPYTVRIGSEVSGENGNPVLQNPNTTEPGAVFSFQTRLAPPDDEPPVLAASTPADSAQATVNQAFTLTFSEEIDPATVNPTSVRLHDAQGNFLDLDVMLSDDRRTAQVQPAAALRAGTDYALVLTSAITDWAGNSLVADSVLFSTVAAQQPRATGPARLSVSVLPPQATYRVKMVLDGRTIGYMPIMNLEVTPNERHRVELLGTDLNSSYTVSLHTRQIMLEPGQHFQIRQEVPPFGSFTVSSEPYADVFIDGRRVGSTPLAGFVLLGGEHDLELHPTFEYERNYTIYRDKIQIPPFDDLNLGRVNLPPK